MEKEATLQQQLYISKPENMQRLSEFARGKGFVVSPDDLATALEQYQEKFATGSIQPLKAYLNGYKRLPASTEAATEGGTTEE